VEPNIPGISILPFELERYKLLAKSGALDDLTRLRKENEELDRLLNDTAALFVLSSIEEMIDLVISRLLDRFIPGCLSFLIEGASGDYLSQYHFKNYKKSDLRLSVEAYEKLKAGFDGANRPFTEAEMADKVGPLDPEVAALSPDHFLPMVGISGIYGVMILGKKLVGDEYSPLERMYVDRFVRFLSIGIQNRLHHESSITDAKTGLFNNRYLMRRLEEEIQRTRRHGSTVGFIMVDVDHFKKFNDTWGHLAGDEVLKAIAATLRREVRNEDIPARFGGEEFCVLLIECDENMVIDVAERARKAVEATTVRYGDAELSVTISLGCCIMDAECPGSAEDVIERADKALYRSKSGGRNRVSIYRKSLLARALEKDDHRH
jgi:diguanylate cyclase (GGDEF)-like protein